MLLFQAAVAALSNLTRMLVSDQCLFLLLVGSPVVISRQWYSLSACICFPRCIPSSVAHYKLDDGLHETQEKKKKNSQSGRTLL